MAAKDKISPDQFNFMYKYDEEVGEHTLSARLKPAGRHVGMMSWYPSGPITGIDVDEEYRRRGVATAMYHHAKALSRNNPEIDEPEHSMFRTKQGDAWARSTGDYVPDTDPLGDRD